ncbi:unnamed protein product [Didymodactylos carnosus]|uniref:Uncharacterized protein n=1 Tax=Didymodactylos carnosus TaxID=1234261 RepID=A0A8S2CJW2_9BILA|nr:unnamed protein product [Didymodactylos carnosus]CAF3492516.1 unnamed protein product [Didymodactylos carnosus]
MSQRFARTRTSDVLSLRFNQDSNVGRVTYAEMLYRTNLIAYVPADHTTGLPSNMGLCEMPNSDGSLLCYPFLGRKEKGGYVQVLTLIVINLNHFVRFLMLTKSNERRL